MSRGQCERAKMGQMTESGPGSGGHFLKAGCTVVLNILLPKTEVWAANTADFAAGNKHLGGRGPGS